MCGIAGYVTTGNRDERFGVALAILAVYMETRGSQSWGWTDGTEIVKDVGRITRGLRERKFYQSPVAMIHTRHATQGDITAENSHPYAIKGIVGMHNGMLDNHHELNAKYGRDCKVDSQHLFHHLADGLSLRDINGYGTIVFSSDGHHFIGHFQGGELSIARHRQGLGYLFASTQAAVLSAMTLSGLDEDEFVFYNTKDGELYEMHPDDLYRVDRQLDVSAMWSGNTWDMGTSKRTAKQNKTEFQAEIEALLGSDDDAEIISICHYCGQECDEEDAMFELAHVDGYICEECTLTCGLDVPCKDIHRIDNEAADCAYCDAPDGDLFTVYDDKVKMCLGCLVEMYHSQELRTTARTDDPRTADDPRLFLM